MDVDAAVQHVSECEFALTPLNEAKMSYGRPLTASSNRRCGIAARDCFVGSTFTTRRKQLSSDSDLSVGDQACLA